MQKDWFACFSMVFWCVTKVAGLMFAIFGIQALNVVIQIGFPFGAFLLTVLVPLALAFVLLATEIVFDLATAEMRGRQAVTK